jgi:hypothetical protein
MPRFLVAIHHPGYDPAVAEDEAMDRAIDAINEALNDAMQAAGVRVFVGGLHPAHTATSLRAHPTGAVLATDGPYRATPEHVGGFWVLDVADREAALAWGR